MGLPSGTFNVPFSGKLQVTFSGAWTETNTHADWSPGGANELWIRGIVDDGTVRKTVLLGFAANSGVIDLDYTANTAVDVSMEEVDYTVVGISSVQATDLLIRCYLLKQA